MRTFATTLVLLLSLAPASGCVDDDPADLANGAADAGGNGPDPHGGFDAGALPDAGLVGDGGAPPPPTGGIRLGARGAVTRGAAAVLSGSGALFVVGTTNGALDPQGPHGSIDTFLARVSADGALEWLRQLGGRGHGGLVVRAHAAALDRAGDLIVAGTLNGRPEFQGEPLPALYNGFVAAFDATDGSQKWLRIISDASGNTELMGVRVADDSAIVAAGYTTAGTLHGAASLGAGDVLLSWLSERGEVLSVRRYGGTGEEYPSAFGAGPHGLYFARQQVAAAAGGPTALELVQVGFDGVVRHRRSFADPVRWAIAGLAGVTDGVCAASQIRSLSPEGIGVIGYGLSCFDERLEPRYELHGSDGANDARAFGLHCEADRHCTLYGFAAGPVDGVPSHGFSDGFVVRIDPLGRRRWTMLLGDDDEETPTRIWSVLPAPGGEHWIFGDTQGELFGSAIGIADAFVARISGGEAAPRTPSPAR